MSVVYFKQYGSWFLVEERGNRSDCYGPYRTEEEASTKRADSRVAVLPIEPAVPELREAWLRALVAAWAVRNGYKSVSAKRADELLRAYQALATRCRVSLHRDHALARCSLTIKQQQQRSDEPLLPLGRARN
jgi:hypothetical protein